MPRSPQIFEVSEATFQQAALETFHFQAKRCAPYREYLQGIGVEAAQVRSLEQIPFLPIEVFKHREVYCGEREPEVIFTSSGTSSGNASAGSVRTGDRGEAGGATTGLSRHWMESLAHYEQAFTGAFRTFYGDPAGWSLYGLLPSYLEREGSSLVYMVERLMAASGSGGFYLNDYERLLADMAADPKPKILLGVSYALWDLAERYEAGGRAGNGQAERTPAFENTIVMETGGMKGRREELPKAEFHRLLSAAFGVAEIHSEYGMAELTSQAYSQGHGIFHTPAWMRVLVRDVNDPFELLPVGARGGLNIIDLANRHSCAFIQTQDIGRVHEDGSFEVEGRIDRSDVRGCNLLIQ